MTDNEWTYHNYWETVESIGREAIEEAKNFASDFENAREMVDTNIHESCDGCAWVIYTAGAIQTLIHSDNEDAIFEVGADTSAWESFSMAVTQMAYWALQADVMERMPDEWEEALETHFEEKDNPGASI